MTPLVAIAALLVFCGASFFFALAETSLFSLGKWQVRQLEENSPGLGKIISRLLAQPQDLTATLVLGNSFANAGIVGLILWVSLRENWPEGWMIFCALVVILFGGEVAPKTLAVRAPGLWSLRVARPMWFLQNFTRPLRQIAQQLTNFILRLMVPPSVKPPAGLSDAEYKELLEMAYQQGALKAGEKEIILQIVDLDRRQAKDVMKGRTQMISISDDLSVEEMLTAARASKHRRLPMYDETPDTIVGVLNTRELLLDPHADLSNAIEFPSFVPESMNLLQLLKSLQRQQRGLAIVMDEFGGTAGIVSIEDILAEVLGKMRGENETSTVLLEKTGEGKWRVGGSVSLDDFSREYPALGEVDGVETMAGLMLHQLEVVPVTGESILYHGLRLTALVADERRVREILVETVKKK